MDANQGREQLSILKKRFEENRSRHPGIDWDGIQAKLEAAPEKLKSLFEMEQTGGEPDVIGGSGTAGEYRFFDCSPESPIGRRSLCYDREALDSRKSNKPGGSIQELAFRMGIEVLTEEEYRELQNLGVFDSKTSSWIETPPHIRKLGGALFCDRRFDTVFVFHNTAECYYAARGFRGRLTVQ